ncbi:MAG: MarR family transcriptional regulator [Myxococcota bacterium]
MTEVLGLLDRGLLATEHSLTEARVLFELAHAERWQRQALQERLGIDPSFLTRVLQRLQDRGLVHTTPSAEDRRRRELSLTEAGRAAFRELDRRSSAQIDALVAPLSADQQRTVGASMAVLGRLIHAGDRAAAP